MADLKAPVWIYIHRGFFLIILITPAGLLVIPLQFR